MKIVFQRKSPRSNHNFITFYLEFIVRRSSRRLSSRDKSATKVEQNNTTLGPKSMAKLKKAAAKLKENDLMNKTAPVEAIEEAQVGRKKRSRSVTNESAKKVKVQVNLPQ